MRSVEILGVRLDDLSDTELDEKLRGWLAGQGSRMIVTPNPEMLLDAKRYSWFRDVLNGADLSLADGFGIQLFKSVQRHTGVDAVEGLVRIGTEQGSRVLFLGGEAGVAEAAANIMREKYTVALEAIDPGKIAIDADQRVRLEPEIVGRIKDFAPEVLVVALGQKKQELLIAQNINMFPSVKVAIGVGGAFDMISGRTRRAPAFMRKVGFEWLWRLVLEPRRIGRIFRAVIIFPITVFFSRLRSL